MAKITLTYEADKEEDGYDGQVQIIRNEMFDLQELMWFLTEATKAIGFSYVRSVGCVKNDNTEVWSAF